MASGELLEEPMFLTTRFGPTQQCTDLGSLRFAADSCPLPRPRSTSQVLLSYR